MRRGLRNAIALIIAVALLAATHPWWLAALGSYLVQAEPPQKAPIIVVLAGDSHGHRILQGGELVRSGFAPRALVSGAGAYYGHSEDELAIPFAVRHGYPETYFEGFPLYAHSTREEAILMSAELKRRGIHKALVVTSDYHTRRTRRMFRAAAPDLHIVVVAARDEWFRASDWWTRREARKTFLMEWVKTLASYFGI